MSNFIVICLLSLPGDAKPQSWANFDIWGSVGSNWGFTALFCYRGFTNTSTELRGIHRQYWKLNRHGYAIAAPLIAFADSPTLRQSSLGVQSHFQSNMLVVNG